MHLAHRAGSLLCRPVQLLKADNPHSAEGYLFLFTRGRASGPGHPGMGSTQWRAGSLSFAPETPSPGNRTNFCSSGNGRGADDPCTWPTDVLTFRPVGPGSLFIVMNVFQCFLLPLGHTHTSIYSHPNLYRPIYFDQYFPVSTTPASTVF